MAVAVLGAIILLGGNGSEGEVNDTNQPLPVETTDVASGVQFSIELSMERITEYMTESMGRGGGNPGGGNPGGNGAIPGKDRNRTRPGEISEFLVAVPESLKVEDPTSSIINVRVIRESQEGHIIYGVNITGLSYDTYDPSNPPSIDLNLTAPALTGTYDIYITTVMFSGLDTSSTSRRVIGEYPIGDLTFIVKETYKVGEED